MNKYQCLKILENNGDSIIKIADEGYIGATTDFSWPYIRSKRFTKLPREKNTILVWDWTNDAFKSIDVTKIKSIKPLSDILRNIRDDGEKRQSW
jgi:hypothetical protein